MASIRKRDTKWHVQIRRAGQPSITKSFVQKSLATEWARQTEADLDRTRFMLNLDGAGGPYEKSLFVYGHDTRDYFRTLSAEFNDDLIVDMDRSPLREPEHISADHYPFVAAGLPSGFIRDPGLSVSTGFYHTAHDTVDKVRLIDIPYPCNIGRNIRYYEFGRPFAELCSDFV